MQILIFIAYLLFFSWILTIIPFFKNSGINKYWLIGLYLIKVAAGFAYAWYFSLPQYVTTADTWKYYNLSIAETNWLMHDPLAFVKDFFSSPYTTDSNLFAGSSSYWNDLKDNSIVKFTALINVITNKSYYTNILFFNFLFLFGPVALFRIIKGYFPFRNSLLFVPVFLLPSNLFWCSGIHKDGLIFSAITLGTYCIWKQLKQNKLILKYALVLVICLLLLFALRNAIFFLFVPAAAVWWLSEKKALYKWRVFGLMYLTGGILFFALPHLSSILNFPQYIVNKQAEFNALSGNSKIILPQLQPTLVSFAKFLPYAFDLIFFRPHLNNIAGVNYLLAFAENIVLVILILVWIIWHQPLKKVDPLFLFLLFFSVSVLLLCGYTVTFSGAVVRYKSIVTPLLVTYLFLTIDYRKLVFIKLIK